MARTSWMVCLMVAGLTAGLAGTSAWSQDQPRPDSGKSSSKGGDSRGDRGRGGDDRRRGNFNPEDMRRRIEEFQQRQSEELKKQLGFTDEEWKEVEPRIRRINTLQSRSRGFGGPGGGSFGRGPGGPGGPPSGSSTSARPEGERTEASLKAEALRELIAKDSASPEEINKALEALRVARKKQAEELEKARKDLRELLTLKQEAILVSRGILE